MEGLRKTLIPVAVATIVLISVVALTFVLLKEEEPSYVEGPIAFSSNADVAESKLLRKGNGTAADPYLISGFDVVVSRKGNDPDGYGMRISGVTAHLLVLDLHFKAVTGGPTWENEMIGIAFWSTSNVIVERCTFENLTKGVQVTKSWVRLDNNSFESCRIGVYLEDYDYHQTSGVDIADNTFYDNEFGIYVYEDTLGMTWTDVRILNNSFNKYSMAIEIPFAGYRFTISGNDFYDGSGYALSAFHLSRSEITDNRMNEDWTWGGGFDISASNNITISGNDLGAHDAAISLDGSWDVLISENHISGARTGFSTTGFGIVVENSMRVNVTNNRIEERNIGIVLISTGPGNSSVWVYRNVFSSNLVQALDNAGADNHWDDGVHIGNYWTSIHDGPGEYDGFDLDHDGVGDTPYMIDSDSIDHYPLITIPF